MNQEVYRFDNSVDYLLFEFERKKLKNSKFSLRAWASQLDFKNPAFLSQILARKRKLKLELAKKISKNLNLRQTEAKYFETLVLLENARTPEEKSLIHDLLFSLRAPHEGPALPISLDIFKFVSDWYHVVILEILNLQDFNGSSEFIEVRLSGQISRTQIRQAIERLRRLDLITRNAGKISRTKESSLLVDSNLPSEAVRSFHSQMGQKALLAIDQQPLEQRDLRGSTLCFRQEDYVRAKKLIAELHKKLSQLSRTRDGQSIYQLNTQLFKLLPTPSKGPQQ